MFREAVVFFDYITYIFEIDLLDKFNWFAYNKLCLNPLLIII